MSLTDSSALHRPAAPALPRAFSEALGRTPMDHYVIWTGQDACGRAGSLRSRAFACLREVGVPISLRLFLQQVAQIEGLDPDGVRGAVRQHQAAKPAVVFLVSRLSTGDFVAVTDIPYAGALNRRIRAGEVVLDRTRRSYVDGLANAA